jgi:hypothetical protein
MHGVKDDCGSAISTGFVEANPTMPCLTATHVPLPHLPRRPFSEFPKDRLEFSTPLKILPLLLFAHQKSVFGAEFFQGEAASASNCFSNHRFLQHFGTEMVLLLPFRHSTNEIHQQTRNLLFEAVLGRDNPALDGCNCGAQPATLDSRRARFRSGSGAGNKWQRP